MNQTRQLKICSYLKRNKKIIPDKFKTAWIQNTKFKQFLYFTNTYTAFMLNEIPCFPIPINYNYKDVILPKIANTDLNTMSLTPINLNDLKEERKILRKNEIPKSTQFININECTYNINYLIECMEILSGKNIKFYQPKENKLLPSIFKSENGTAIIMPVRR